jgi:hypothetical protein
VIPSGFFICWATKIFFPRKSHPKFGDVLEFTEQISTIREQ